MLGGSGDGAMGSSSSSCQSVSTGHISDTDAVLMSEPQSIGLRAFPNSVQTGLLVQSSEATPSPVEGRGAEAGRSVHRLARTPSCAAAAAQGPQRHLPGLLGTAGVQCAGAGRLDAGPQSPAGVKLRELYQRTHQTQGRKEPSLFP